MRLAVLLTLAILLAPVPARAQSLWMPRDRGGSVVLEALRTGIEFVEDKFPTGALFLDVRVPVSHAWLVAEVPYGRLKGDYLIFIGSSGVTESSLGNPYLGLETRGDSPFFGELGVRAPLADEDKLGALATGAYSDVGRFNSFLPHQASIQAAFNVRTVSQDGIASRLRLGFAVRIPTRSRRNGDPELYGLYA